MDGGGLESRSAVHQAGARVVSEASGTRRQGKNWKVPG